MKRRKRDLFHQRSAHVVSCDFRSLPASVWEEAKVDRNTYCNKIPFIRLNEQNRLLINEGDAGWEVFEEYLCALDVLPDQILRDMYGYYRQICGNITLETIKGRSDNETARNIFYMLIPEILWCHGDTTVKGRIFPEMK